ncbi:hypothetical protein FQR65_LT10589 [Abscondita terminalis]|nr:hypothetical protein FQR65_LT10589 [Abscondita terminalis]
MDEDLMYHEKIDGDDEVLGIGTGNGERVCFLEVDEIESRHAEVRIGWFSGIVGLSESRAGCEDMSRKGLIALGGDRG